MRGLILRLHASICKGISVAGGRIASERWWCWRMWLEMGIEGEGQGMGRVVDGVKDGER